MVSRGKLFAVIFCDLFAVSLLSPLLPLLSLQLGASTLQSGLLTGAYSLCQFLFSPWVGRASDSRGRGPLLLASALVSVVSYLLIALSPQSGSPLLVLFGARVLAGFAANTLALIKASLADQTSGRSMEAVGSVVGSAFALAFTLGPVAGGLLAQEVGAANVALVAAVVSLAQVQLVRMWFSAKVGDRSSDKDRGGASQAGTQGSSDQDQGSPRGQEAGKIGAGMSTVAAYLVAPGPIAALLRLRAVSSFASLLFNTTIILYSRRFGYSPRGTGMILGYIALLVGAFQRLALKRLATRFSEAGIFSLGLGLTGPAMVVWALAPTPAVYLFSLIPLCLARIKDPAHDSLLTQLSSRDNYGEVMGVAAAIDSLMRALASVAGAALVETWGSGAPGLVGALISAACLVIWRSDLRAASLATTRDKTQ